MPTFELPPTSATLLRLLTLPDADTAWAVFVERYTPLVEERCRAAGLQPADIDDVRAEVFAHLVNALKEFRYDPARRFRGYLARAVDNAVRTHWRRLARRPGWVGSGGPPNEDPPEPLARLGHDLDGQANDRIDWLLQSVDEVRTEVGTDAWTAFWLTAVEGLAGAEAAARLGKSPAAVYMAKSRVLSRLRQAIDTPDA